jgi:hypothetical protein
MSAVAPKLLDCPVCKEQHEAFMLHGMEFVPCPQVPENVIIQRSALQQQSVGQKTVIDSIRRTLHNALLKLDNLESLTTI